MIARALLLDRTDPNKIEWRLRGNRHTRPRPSYSAVAREMGGTVARENGHAVVTFPERGEARAYAEWLDRVRREPMQYSGGTAVAVVL
jgi:hypothetical protein